MPLYSNCFIDKIIGPVQKNTITTFFGPPGVGKSTICFQYLVSTLKKGKQVIFIDTEGGFSIERLKLISNDVDLKNIIVFSPKSFEEQHKLMKNLGKEIKNSKRIGLVIVDSLVMLYRLKLGDSPQKINSELGEQLRILNEISRNFNIPIIVTNQMYTSFETKESKMVGGTILEYWSKTIVELKKEGFEKKAQLKKHKFKPEGEEIFYLIDDSGLKETKQKVFSFFSR